jgi:hypothetical protein
MICFGHHLVCVSVYPNREMWADRSTDEHPVWSKTFHPDIGRKKTHPKIQPSFPLFWGRNEERVWKNAEKTR